MSEGGSRAGQQRKEGRQEIRGEKGETKEVTLAIAFSEGFSVSAFQGFSFSPVAYWHHQMWEYVGAHF